MRKGSALAPRVRPKPSGRYHHGELRRALLDAALAIVSREGPEALSLRAVAARIGVSAQATYNHFPDKAALLAAAAEEGLRVLEQQLREARDRATGPGARLEATGVAYVRFAAAHAAHFRLLGVPDLADKGAHPALGAAYEAAFSVLLDTIEECQAAGVVREGAPRELALAAWSTVHGLAGLVVDGQASVAGLGADSEALATRVVRVLFKGLAARRERAGATAARPRARGERGAESRRARPRR